MSSEIVVPGPVARLRDLLSSFPAPWALCGGWSVDAWAGRVTRRHGDIDVIFFQADQVTMRAHLAGWQMVAHDGGAESAAIIYSDQPMPGWALWQGRWVAVPGHFHTRPPGGYDAEFDLDLNLIERAGDEWLLTSEPRVALPFDAAVRQSPWGVPTVVPEVAAYFKLVGIRQQGEPEPRMRKRDVADVELLLPMLSPERRAWLRDAVALVEPGHDWLDRL